MERIRLSTLVALARELPAFDWRTAEFEELVEPRRGIITGFQALLDDLERMRQVDLELLPPAGAVRPAGEGDGA